MIPAVAPWWIVTGAAAAIHGVEGAVADVDVLLGEDDAGRILPTLGVAPAAGDPHPRYRSRLFARWDACPLPVEFMAGFHLDGVEVRPSTRARVTIDGRTLFVPARGELAAMLRTLARLKDLARAALLTS